MSKSFKRVVKFHKHDCNVYHTWTVKQQSFSSTGHFSAIYPKCHLKASFFHDSQSQLGEIFNSKPIGYHMISKWNISCN